MRSIRSFMGGLGNRLFQFGFLYSQVREGKLPDIYLQDYKIFDKYRDELKEILKDGIVESDFVSLHVRRGDYVDNPFYVDLTETDYYQKAIEEFPNERFMVFCSDRQGRDKEDMEWCEEWLETLIPGRFTIVQGETEIDDWNAMAGCKGHIMANSSFSFWASYIGGGKTVAPKQWFANGTSIPLPEEFILL